MVSNEVKRTTISITQQTKGALDSIKHPGQSYDGVIRELLKSRSEYWTRRKVQKVPVA